MRGMTYWKSFSILAKPVGIEIQKNTTCDIMIFLDTSYINSLIIKNDPYRQYAKNIQPLLETEAKITNITVLVEVLNSISPYNFFGDVVELKDYLLNLHDF